MGVNNILVVLVVSFSCINAQDFAIFDQSDFNAWDAEEEGAFLEVDQTITSLCQNYNLVLNNKEIDCASLQLVPKIPEEHNDHVIRKREADETELEGSGNGEIEKPTLIHKTEPATADSAPPKTKPLVEVQENKTSSDEGSKNEPAEIQVSNLAQAAPTTNETKLEQPVEDIKNATVENKTEGLPTNKSTNNTNKNQENVLVPTTNSSALEPGSPMPVGDIKNATVENKTESLPTNESTKNANKNQENVLVRRLETNSTTLEPGSPKPDTTIASQTVIMQNPVVPASHNKSIKLEVKEGAVNGSVSSVNKEVVETSTQAAPQTPVAPVISNKAPMVEEKKEGRSNSTANGVNKESDQAASTKSSPPQMMPSDLAEVESIGNKKEVEPVNEQQSGNVVLLKNPKTHDTASHIEGSESDKAIQGMAENAKISNETDQPSTGESAKNVNRASKDTTILVVLFVIVIAIGGAAFTHNFIKKRKQKSKNNEVVNGIRRSLQNLTAGNGKNTNNDIEQGTELKPLMKENNATITKQFTDVKTEAEK